MASGPSQHISHLPGGFLPLHLAVVAQKQLLHLGEQRVRLMSLVVVILAENELYTLGRRSRYERIKKSVSFILAGTVLEAKKYVYSI